MPSKSGGAFVVPLGLFVMIVAAAGTFAYTGTITDASTSGSGTALTIELCWTSSETAPSASNTSSSASEIDNPPLDPDDPLGSDDAGTPDGEPYQGPGGVRCQKFQFVYPNRDCEQGDEEFSATVTVAGQNFSANGAGGHPYSENIC